MAKGTCSIEGCEARTVARGWCDKHYTRFKRYGNPLTNPRGPDGTLERFLAQCDFDGPMSPVGTRCVLWTGEKNEKGYGIFSYKGRTRGAHRWIYEWLLGPIPDGKELDHFACDRRDCVFPLHCRPVTHYENILRGNGPSAIHLAQTHCVNGHEFTEENTGRTKTGARYCRVCITIRTRERRAREKEQRA